MSVPSTKYVGYFPFVPCCSQNKVRLTSWEKVRIVASSIILALGTSGIAAGITISIATEHNVTGGTLAAFCGLVDIFAVGIGYRIDRPDDETSPLL